MFNSEEPIWPANLLPRHSEHGLGKHGVADIDQNQGTMMALTPVS